MNAIRDDTFLSVVSIWQQDIKDDGSLRFSARRTGLVQHFYNGTCVVFTASKGLSMGKTIFVRFQNEQTHEGSIYPGGQSKLAAILLYNLPFAPKEIEWSNVSAIQCDPVVHIGSFDKAITRLGLSSGSVGLVSHDPFEGGEFTGFAHCCSQKQYMIGAPVCNLDGRCVGVNLAKKKKKNLFFAMDREQMWRESTKLFGSDVNGVLYRILGLDEVAAKAAAKMMAKERKTEKGPVVKKRRTAELMQA